ncbi:UbiX family flavin prenyltransferase [Thermosulfuriphilus sp.]
MRILVAITGASGSIYGKKLLEEGSRAGAELEVIFSEAGQKVYSYELGEPPQAVERLVQAVYVADDLFAPPASGSAHYEAMVICPCTMGTLAAIAQGLANNLIHRAADVFLKEGRPLYLVIRETPFNQIHLKNMLRAAEAGAIIYPAMPAFYHHPQSLEEMVIFFVRRLLTRLGLPVDHPRWGQSP